MADRLDIAKVGDTAREQIEQVCIEEFEDCGFDGLVEMMWECVQSLLILGETLDDIVDRTERGVREVEQAVGL